MAPGGEGSGLPSASEKPPKYRPASGPEQRGTCAEDFGSSPGGKRILVTNYRALVVGAGRMGSGRDHAHPYDIYDHASAYNRMMERVELVGFVDRVLARAEWAAKKFGVKFAGDALEAALEKLRPDVVSVCTPPSDRAEIIGACDAHGVRGLWVEKPYMLAAPPRAVCLVDYIRRYDARHVTIMERRTADPRPADLFVIAAKDLHTVPHFTDLARFWRIPKERFHYTHFHGPSLYILREEGDKPGRYAGWRDEAFVGGGVSGGFMTRALANLLDALDGAGGLVSPAESAVESERWAAEILTDHAASSVSGASPSIP